MAHKIEWMDHILGHKEFVFNPDNPVRVHTGRALCERLQAEGDTLVAKGDRSQGIPDRKLTAFDPSVETTVSVRHIAGG